MILTRLMEEKLVTTDATTSVKKFSAASPAVLKHRLAAQEEQVKRSRLALGAAWPELEAQYKAGQAKQVTEQNENLKKHQSILEELAKTTATVDVIADDGMQGSKDAWALLLRIAETRGRRHITRAVFHKSLKGSREVRELVRHGLKVRFTAERPKTGGVIIFTSNVALIKHAPKLSVTVVNNDVLAGTFQAVFEQFWQDGRGGKP